MLNIESVDFSASVGESPQAESTADPHQPNTADLAPQIAALAGRDFKLFAQLCSGSTSPLAWGVADLSSATKALLKQAKAARGKKSPARTKADPRLGTPLRAWLTGAIPELEQFTTDQSVQTLAVAALLPDCVRAGGAAQEVAERLFQTAEAASASAARLSPLPRMLLAAELPLLLGYCRLGPRDGHKWTNQGAEALAKTVADLIDGEGWLVGGDRSLVRPLLASLARCLWLLERSPPELQAPFIPERANLLLANTLRSARPDGAESESAGPATAAEREFWAAVTTQLATPAIRQAAAAAFGKKKFTADPASAPPASGASEAAAISILRTRWSAPADWLRIDHSHADLRLELCSGGKLLLSGVWEFSVAAQGETLAAEHSNEEPGWRHVCWHSDADCDYLELEFPLVRGWRLQRQTLLSRKDRALLLADALLGPAGTEVDPNAPPPRLRYQGRLPLASGAAFAPAAESREGQIALGKQPAALVLPLALPEWRTILAGGELVQAGNQLEYSLETGGRNLYAPLWLDLDPARARKERTWRRLTVGEQLVPQPRDVAAGFRVQVHKQQWLVYRSLGGWGNRTLLGKNFSTDFACCRFLPSGETEDILEIE